MKNASLDERKKVFFPAHDLFSHRNGYGGGGHGSQENLGSLLPGNRLAELLGLEDTAPVEEILAAALLNPIAEVISNPGKRVRGQLVALCYRLASDDSLPSIAAIRKCRSLADTVEFIHAASLIVDDIEDGSSMRRGRPALHIQYGMPLALNAGNWLYFWPYELLKDAGLPADRLLLLYEHCHRTLLRAHFGQAIDLGVCPNAIPQAQVADACIAAMKLKTGALMGFAAVLGGVIAGASATRLSALDEFGRDLGVSLQMFDDLGNVTGIREPSKRYEDLMGLRPSWVWACAANSTRPHDYARFREAVAELPDATRLSAWLEEHDLLEWARKGARRHLDRAFVPLEQRFYVNGSEGARRAFEELRELGEEIATAYE
jgi:geranylgeranyl pyrophosphate synthase